MTRTKAHTHSKGRARVRTIPSVVLPVPATARRKIPCLHYREVRKFHHQYAKLTNVTSSRSNLSIAAPQASTGRTHQKLHVWRRAWRTQSGTRWQHRTRINTRQWCANSTRKVRTVPSAPSVTTLTASNSSTSRLSRMSRVQLPKLRKPELILKFAPLKRLRRPSSSKNLKSARPNHKTKIVSWRT